MPRPCILFVEDDDLIREVVAGTLIDIGCAVTVACNASMALSLIEQESHFDLLLTDVHMPGDLNGIDVALYARSVWPELPVVFATGRPDVLEAVNIPGPWPGCVAKPYTLGDLLAVIGVTSRSAHNHTPMAFQTSPVFQSYFERQALGTSGFSA